MAKVRSGVGRDLSNEAFYTYLVPLLRAETDLIRGLADITALRGVGAKSRAR